MRLQEKKKIALVLSGGGIKAAAFHIGVCLALQEKGFRFQGGLKSSTLDHPLAIKMYVGSSAGSIISALLASGYPAEALIEAFLAGTNLNARRKERIKAAPTLKPITYWDIFSMNGTSFLRLVPSMLKKKSFFAGGIEALLKHGFKVNGLFTTRGIERYFREHVLPTNQFKQLSSELYIIGTQLNHSRKAVFGPFESSTKLDDIKYVHYAKISDAIAASASLPPVFSPYGIPNEKGKIIYFFDGEIRDTLSTHVAVDQGADLVIASYSIQPYHFNPQIGNLNDYGIPMIINQALYQLVEQKIRKHISYQEKIKVLYSAIDGYCKEAKIGEEHRDQLLKIFIKKLDFKPNVDSIYIHPHAHDHEMFFADHFSLSPDILGRIIKSGFRSALSTLRKYQF